MRQQKTGDGFRLRRRLQYEGDELRELMNGRWHQRHDRLDFL